MYYRMKVHYIFDTAAMLGRVGSKNDKVPLQFVPYRSVTISEKLLLMVWSGLLHCLRLATCLKQTFVSV